MLRRLCAGARALAIGIALARMLERTDGAVEVARLMLERRVLLPPAKLCVHGPAPDIMPFREQVESVCQIRLGAGLVPVVETSLIHTNVNIAYLLWAFIRLVKHEPW